jgi:hypothetical protein
MDVDRTAPAVERGQLEVSASPGVVWSVLADIGSWPQWNPEVRSVSIEGPLVAGTRFRWRSGPGTIASTLREVDPPNEIASEGSSFGIRAVHVWRLVATGNGTLVTTEESWRGLLPRLLGQRAKRMLHQAIETGLGHLKAEAERRAGS